MTTMKATLKNHFKLQPWDEHQIKIARQTLLMSDVGASIMGGPTKEEARQILARFGYSDERIAELEA